MASWDDEDFDPDANEEKAQVIPGVTDKWEGEDEEEDVKDNWDDDDEEKPKEAPKPAPKTSEGKKPGKKALARKLKEIEEKERQAREEIFAETKTMTADEKLAEKLRMQKLAEESDLQVAKDTFGVSSDQGDAQPLERIQCTTKEHFQNFEQQLTDKITSFNTSPHYSDFLQSLFVNIFTTLTTKNVELTPYSGPIMPAEQARKVSADIAAIANEKTKIEKAKKGKGKSKAKLAGAKKQGTGDDMLDYSSYNDYDDFM